MDEGEFEIFQEGEGGAREADSEEETLHSGENPDSYAKSLSSVLIPLVHSPGSIKYQGMFRPAF